MRISANVDKLVKNLQGKSLVDLVDIKGRAHHQMEIMNRWANISDDGLVVLERLWDVQRACSLAIQDIANSGVV